MCLAKQASTVSSRSTLFISSGLFSYNKLFSSSCTFVMLKKEGYRPGQKTEFHSRGLGAGKSPLWLPWELRQTVHPQMIRAARLLMFSFRLWPSFCRPACNLIMWIVYYAKPGQALKQLDHFTVMSRKFHREMIPTEDLKNYKQSFFLNPFGGVNVSGGMGEKKEAVIFQCLVMRVVSEEKGDWASLTAELWWWLSRQSPNCMGEHHIAKRCSL